jgi:PhzF family phenazine biosynthesis protein
MSSLPFSVVDVFSKTPYKGNPLAVVDTLSTPLTDTQMKLITRQFNLSETTFVAPPTIPNATYRLRSFLPDGKEVFGAGHNSLGALWWLAKHGHLDSIAPADHGAVNFNQQMGPDAMPVTVFKDAETLSVTLRQVTPEFFGAHPNPGRLAQTLGFADGSAIGFEIGGTKIKVPQVVSTSTTRHLLVPVANEDVLNSVAILDREKLLEEIRAADPLGYGLFLFTPRASSSADGLPLFVARFFSPGMSGEDPATGSAAGPMGAYLQKRRLLNVQPGQERQVRVLQGLRTGRECLLTVTVWLGKDGDSSINTKLTGEGVEVMHGELAIPASDTLF